jgi:hypothetical protein
VGVSALGEVKEDWMERTARQKARASHSSSTTVGRRGDGCCVDDDALVIGAGRSEVGWGTGDAMLQWRGKGRGVFHCKLWICGTNKTLDRQREYVSHFWFLLNMTVEACFGKRL